MDKADQQPTFATVGEPDDAAIAALARLLLDLLDQADQQQGDGDG